MFAPDSPLVSGLVAVLEWIVAHFTAVRDWAIAIFQDLPSWGKVAGLVTAGALALAAFLNAIKEIYSWLCTLVRWLLAMKGRYKRLKAWMLRVILRWRIHPTFWCDEPQFTLTATTMKASWRLRVRNRCKVPGKLRWLGTNIAINQIRSDFQPGPTVYLVMDDQVNKLETIIPEKSQVCLAYTFTAESMDAFLRGKHYTWEMTTRRFSLPGHEWIHVSPRVKPIKVKL